MKELFSIRVREYTYRAVIFAVIISATVIVCVSLWYAYNAIEESKKNIYVLKNDKALLRAESTDITNSYDILAKGTIERLNQLIYQQVPDVNNINKQLHEAINMTDKSAASVIDALRTHEYYNNIVNQTYFTLLTTDTIAINYSKDPRPFQYKGTLKIIRKDQIAYRKIVTEGLIQETRIVTSGNQEGFIIYNFKLISDN